MLISEVDDMHEPRMVFPGIENAVTEMILLAQEGERWPLDEAQCRRLALLLRYLHQELTILATSTALAGRAVDTYLTWRTLAVPADTAAPIPVAEVLQTLQQLLAIAARDDEEQPATTSVLALVG